MTRFRVAEHGAMDGVENMRLDVEMLSKVESDGISLARIYRWNGAWVSLGRNQSHEDALLPDSGVPWVVRPTGGKGVLHGNDITVSLAAPVSAIGRLSLKEVYKSLTEPIILALNECGATAALAEASQSQSASADCFLSVAPTDVIDVKTRRKVVGCALRVTRKAVLAQCSIPLGPPLVNPSQVFRGVSDFGQNRSIDDGTLVLRLINALETRDLAVH